MKLRSIKYEFSAQRKEAHEAVEENMVASVRSELGKILNLKRPLKIQESLLKQILKKL
jgi:hypothetical protein